MPSSQLPSAPATLKPWLSLLFKLPSWVAFFVLWLIVLPAHAALTLRVAIEDGTSQVQVGTSTAAVVRDGNGQPVAQLGAMQGVRATRQGGNVALGRKVGTQFTIEPTQNGLVWIDNAWYRGTVRLVAAPQGIVAVNHVDLEEYLYSVVGSEMPTSWPLEALKAQAVAARSYALYKRGRVSNSLYDLGSTTTWQAYSGVKSEATTTQAAVQQTNNQVLTYGGKIIEAVFHSSSGGHTENAEDVWTQPLPYLRGVTDYDQIAPVFSWSETFTASQMQRLIPGVGNILSIVPINTTPNGRVRELKIIGDGGQTTIRGDQVREALNLRSSLFVVTPEGGRSKSTAPQAFVVRGRGFGHGLGLSQWGACNLARQGYNYQQILGHYYQNVALARVEVSR